MRKRSPSRLGFASCSQNVVFGTSHLSTTSVRYPNFACTNELMQAQYVRKSAKRIILIENLHIKKRTLMVLFFVYGTPKRIRIAVYTVKGCCPRPLDDGGLSTFPIVPNQFLMSSRIIVKVCIMLKPSRQ